MIRISTTGLKIHHKLYTGKLKLDCFFEKLFKENIYIIYYIGYFSYCTRLCVILYL